MLTGPTDRADTQKIAREADAAWRLEPHICRGCFARLVSRPVDGGRQYQCTNCGAEAVAREASAVCCCGMKLRKSTATGKAGGLMIDAGIRCIPNPNQSPEFPALFVAAEVGRK